MTLVMTPQGCVYCEEPDRGRSTTTYEMKHLCIYHQHKLLDRKNMFKELIEQMSESVKQMSAPMKRKRVKK